MLIPGLPWDCALLLALLAVLPAWRGTLRVHRLLAMPAVNRAGRARMYTSTMAAQWLASGVVLWRAHARGWSVQQLGLSWGRPGLTLAVGLLLALALAMWQRFGLGRLVQAPKAREGILYHMLRKVMPQSAAEVPLFTALIATVGVCEEFLFRGFVFEAFLRMSNRATLLALLASSILFAIGHLYQGAPGLVSTFGLGLIFGGVRVWTSSLFPGMLAHAVTDLVAGVVGPSLLQKVDRAAAEGVPGNTR